MKTFRLATSPPVSRIRSVPAFAAAIASPLGAIRRAFAAPSSESVMVTP